MIYTEQAIKAAVSSYPDEAWTKLGGENDSEVAELVKQVSWLYGVHRKRAGGTSGLPVELQLNGEKVDKKDWPVEMDLPDLLYRYSLATDLYGENYMFQVKQGQAVIGVKWFDPTTITIEQNAQVGLLGFTRSLGANKKTYPVKKGKSRVMWTWLPGLVEIGPGEPPANVVEDAANILRYMTLTSKGFFERGAVDSFILFGNQAGIPESARKRFVAWWNRTFFGGYRKGHSMEVLSTDSRVEKISSSPADWILPDLNDMKAEEICVAHETPLMLLRPNEGADKAMMKETKLAWINETIIPHAQRMVDTLNMQLFEDMGYELVILAESMNVNQEEEHMRSQSVANLVSAGETLDNAYKILGYDIPDDLEERDEPEPEPEPQPVIMPQPEEVDDEVKSVAWFDDERRLTTWLKKRGPDADVNEFNSNELTHLDKLEIYTKVFEDADIYDWRNYP